MNKKCLMITLLLSLNYLLLSAQNDQNLLKHFPDEYLNYAQENYFILHYFPLNDDFKTAVIGGEGGTLSVLLNHENLITDTFRLDQEYLGVKSVLSLTEETFYASADPGILSFNIVDSKISNLEVITENENNRYYLASINQKVIYMKPKDVIRNKLRWRVLDENSDEVIYESKSKFKDFKNVMLPNVWNRIYYIDSLLVFNDPLNSKILTYNPFDGHFNSFPYPCDDGEIRFLYHDAVHNKSYLVGFRNGIESYIIYEIDLLNPDEYVKRKTIEYKYPPKSIQGNAVYVEDLFIESGRNCIVRIPLD